MSSDEKISSSDEAPTSREPFNQLDDWIHQQLARSHMGLSPISLYLAALDWIMHLGISPGRQFELGVKRIEQMQQWKNQVMDLYSNGQLPPSAGHLDDRFADKGWEYGPFSLWRERFLADAEWWREASHVDGMSRHHQQLVEFYARQWMDALSPANVPFLNPQVQQRALETQGESLRDGWIKLWADTVKALWSPPDVLDVLTHRVGQDVAATPGEVVYRNHLFELIQYHPTTASVVAEPLLIVPSTIMKYYILDLSTHNSMIQYLVNQGFTVLVMSWRNPDATDRDLGMDDYLIEGVMQAMHQTAALTRSRRIHTMGYCLGGTFLAIVASLLGSTTQRKGSWPNPMPELASTTLLAAQTDFSEPGELGLFIDEDQLKTLREEMARTGYLSGKQMAGTFQFLNSRDMIWSKHIQRHFLGKDEVGSDMMSWNADTTRLPERMHNEYLRQLFLDNALRNGTYKVRGHAVSVENMTAPLMVIGTEKDHVAPWRSVFKILLDSQVDSHFILASGGHNAGVISEPGHPHRHYRTGVQTAQQAWVSPDEWLQDAVVHSGSWWPAWSEWLQAQSSQDTLKPRRITRSKSLGPAPGDYVMVRYSD